MANTPHHPDDSQLTALLQGQLSAARQLKLRQHVERCASCRRRLERLQAPASAATEQLLRDHPRYSIVRMLGAGGMGVVYLARHRVMDREVAIKVLAPKYSRDPQALERFGREIKATARLDHPNITRAYDAERLGDDFMLIMEYVDGRTLEQLVRRRGPLPIPHAVHYVRQACKGLQYAHERQLIHRDLKPSNLMLGRDGVVKILDFGLAILLDEAAGASEARGVGTPSFLSPEQALRDPGIDIRSDLYSLGCTLFFLLAGRPPFWGGGKARVVSSHLRDAPPPVDQFRPDVPAELSRLIDRLLAKDPDDRPATPEQLRHLLRPFVKSEYASVVSLSLPDLILTVPVAEPPPEPEPEHFEPVVEVALPPPATLPPLTVGVPPPIGLRPPKRIAPEPQSGLPFWLVLSGLLFCLILGLVLILQS